MPVSLPACLRLSLVARGDAAFDVRDTLIELVVPRSSISAHRNDQLQDVTLRVRYRS